MLSYKRLFPIANNWADPDPLKVCTKFAQRWYQCGWRLPKDNFPSVIIFKMNGKTYDSSIFTKINIWGNWMPTLSYFFLTSFLLLSRKWVYILRYQNFKVAILDNIRRSNQSTTSVMCSPLKCSSICKKDRIHFGKEGDFWIFKISYSANISKWSLFLTSFLLLSYFFPD